MKERDIEAMLLTGPETSQPLRVVEKCLSKPRVLEQITKHHSVV